MIQVLTPVELDRVLRATHRDNAGLEELGYTVTGGVRIREGRFGVQKAIMMDGPSKDRSASVTVTAFSSILLIGSNSTDGRSLVSRNGGFWESPPWELCNDFPVASPRQLDEAHSDALERVRGVFTPRIRPEGRTIEERIEDLGRYYASIDDYRLAPGPGSGFGLLGGDAASAQRIESWALAEPP